MPSIKLLQKIRGLAPSGIIPQVSDTPIELGRYVVVDLELTGLSLQNDSIISIGAIKMDGLKIRLGDFFYRVIQTDRCQKESILIHGITPSESSLCPDIKTILPEFLNYCSNRIMIGHFISIDAGFINRDLRRLYRKNLENPLIDTNKLYQWLKKKRLNPDAFYQDTAEGKSLLEMAKELDIPVSGLHNAIYDAFITAQIFQRFLYMLKAEGLKTIGELLKIGGER